MRTMGAAALLTVLLATSPPAAAAALEGFWYGAYLEEGQIGRVGIDVASGTLDLPGSMIFDLPVKIAGKGGEVSVEGEFRGHPLRIVARRQGDLLSGTFALGDTSLPFQATPNPRKVIRGRELPAFEVQALEGEGKLSNADLAGKLTLIDFWATWCGRCQGEVPHLEAAYEKFGDRVQFLSISVDEDRRRWAGSASSGPACPGPTPTSAPRATWCSSSRSASARAGCRFRSWSDRMVASLPPATTS